MLQIPFLKDTIWFFFPSNLSLKNRPLGNMSPMLHCALWIVLYIYNLSTSSKEDTCVFLKVNGVTYWSISSSSNFIVWKLKGLAGFLYSKILKSTYNALCSSINANMLRREYGFFFFLFFFLFNLLLCLSNCHGKMTSSLYRQFTTHCMNAVWFWTLFFKKAVWKMWIWKYTLFQNREKYDL